MKPHPFSSLNHFTLPTAIGMPPLQLQLGTDANCCCCWVMRDACSIDYLGLGAAAAPTLGSTEAQVKNGSVQATRNLTTVNVRMCARLLRACVLRGLVQRVE